MRVHGTVLLAALSLAVAFGLSACASNGGEASESAAAAQQAPPPGSKLAQVKIGMNDVEVRKILGEPDSANAYQTGKAWIPFYFGPDTARSDWIYKGEGRVVYSRNQYTGGLKVIRVIYNPAEAGG
jgi:hypothetical protein